MNSSSKNYLIAFLLVTALGGGVLAWQQYVELVALRAGAANPTDQAAAAARLAAAQRYARELEDQLAAARAATPSDLAEASDTSKAANSNPSQNQNGRGRGGPANFRALMQNPEMQKLMSQQQKAALDSRYAALFKTLNLSPAQLDKFKALLLEKQSTIQDVMSVARDQGVDPRTDPDGFRKLVAASQADLDANLKATLGDAGFTQYQQYQQSEPQRNAVSQLQQSLSYTDTPLSEAQAAQLTQILAATSTQFAGGGGRGGAGGGGGGPLGAGGGTGAAALITTQTIAQAQTVLSATQVAALQQLQQTQQAQQQIEKLLRAANNTGGQATNRATAGGG